MENKSQKYQEDSVLAQKGLKLYRDMLAKHAKTGEVDQDLINLCAAKVRYFAENGMKVIESINEVAERDNLSNEVVGILKGVFFSSCASELMENFFHTTTQNQKPRRNKMTYNGWTNRETWAVNVWFEPKNEKEVLYAKEFLEEAYNGMPDPLKDMCYLSEVNWDELIEWVKEEEKIYCEGSE